ncbi:DUF418 domain-containing protein [Pedobacter polaris]|uniref:DUF418 domain-containing protein n=1 Tax=Pedobacter polaris TaxID=2571273 RepID=A0A4U1CVI6_9SPHI|nr:DUF418 domain-containing protein [Pedobacter polaris]TKC12934.1 DUF418 domain-containing protein [Pedobacter polaris]
MSTLNQPIQQNQRTIIVDVLRGWALLGVVLMNYFDFFTLGRNWQTFKPDTFTNVLMYASSIIFSAKSWTLLSLLFGYGFAVLMNNIKEKGHNAYGFFAGRMFWLLVLAFINSALFFGDILKDYAILGLILLLFYRSSAKTAFIISIILLLAIPAVAAYISTLPNDSQKEFVKLFPLYRSSDLFDVLWFGLKGTYFGEIISKPYLYTVHVVMFCCFLWGFSLYKINFFNNLVSKLKHIKRAFWISLATAIFLTGLFEIGRKLEWDFLKYYKLGYWLILSSMIFIACSICWLYITGKFKAFFAGLAVMGKMTLTNYMVQNLIGLFIFSGFGFGVWNTKPIWFYFLLAIVVYILQVFFSKWWLSKYNYGPVEWIWRQLSYRKRLPLTK